ADGVDFLVHLHEADVARGHERAGRAGLYAFAAGDAGRGAHGVVQVKDDLGMLAAVGVADHVVDLLFTAGAHAARALDAGVEVDRHRRMRQVGPRLLARGETRFAHAEFLGP